MIYCRFDCVTLGAEASRQTILAVSLPAAPDCGEVVNLTGYPYLVHRRSWAVEELEADAERWATARLYCVLDVLKVCDT